MFKSFTTVNIQRWRRERSILIVKNYCWMFDNCYVHTSFKWNRKRTTKLENKLKIHIRIDLNTVIKNINLLNFS